MSKQATSNLDTLKAFLRQFQSGDWAGACEKYCAEDFEIHEPPGIPQQGIFKGQYASIEVSKIYRSIWNIGIETQHFWEAQDEDIVFSRYVLTWTCRETGKSITQPVVELNSFRGGKLAKMEVFMFNVIGLVGTLDAD